VRQLHTLILLSLGSLLPLSSYFTLPKGCHLHIIDSHRPWNLQNLFGLDIDVNPDEEGGGEGRIWVWGDGEEASLDGVRKSFEALEVGRDAMILLRCSAKADGYSMNLRRADRTTIQRRMKGKTRRRRRRRRRMSMTPTRTGRMRKTTLAKDGKSARSGGERGLPS
jgi:hypothetical protein